MRPAIFLSTRQRNHIIFRENNVVILIIFIKQVTQYNKQQRQIGALLLFYHFHSVFFIVLDVEARRFDAKTVIYQSGT